VKSEVTVFSDPAAEDVNCVAAMLGGEIGVCGFGGAGFAAAVWE
jgi:hypothetical protein